MNEGKVLPTLTLTITDAPLPTDSSGSRCIFDRAGGSIGSAGSDTWQLSPVRTGVVPGHAEVRWADNAFCLIDRSGRTYINNDPEPVGRGRRVRLSQGDEIRLGRYRLSVDVGAAAEECGAVAEQSLSPRDEGVSPPSSGEYGQDDPLEQLQSPAGEAQTEDPVPEWQTSAATPEKFSQDRGMAAGYAVRDYGRVSADTALVLPVTDTGKAGEDRMHKDPEQQEAADLSRQHISAAPLLRGLGVDITFRDTEALQGFMEEAGATLRAAIEGLLALHQEGGGIQRALAASWHPVEDNPLRLEQSYGDTVQILFSTQRSPVHLSAPAAVRESLASLACHRQATQMATREALEAVLQALSPQTLQRRFHEYRRTRASDEDGAGWAWNMYQHYYRELMSERQAGLERLFREVFDQAYDRHMRTLYREKVS